MPIEQDGAISGVLALTRNEVRPFTDGETALATGFAEQAAIGIANARLLETIERQRGQLARFLSPQVAELVSSPDGEAMLAGHRREITAMFCDLRNFTTFSEIGRARGGPRLPAALPRDGRRRSSSSTRGRSSTSPATG